MAKRRSERIHIEAGSEYSPTGVGRILLTLERDGRAQMTRRRVGMAEPDAWSGRVTSQAIIMIAEALERAGFPVVASAGGALLPDEAPTTFTVNRGWWRTECVSVAHRQLNAGYREAIEIFDTLCHVVSGGELGHVPSKLRWLAGPDTGGDHWHDDDDDDARGDLPPPGYPYPGDDVYLPSERYLSRGEDDFLGGRCTVIAVHLGTSAGVPQAFIEVAEQPGVRHSWANLAPRQEELRGRFGEERGHADPDHRPEFNESITDQLIAEGEHHQVPVTFRETGSAEYPLETEWGGKTWRLRLNDFPEEPLYTLFVDGQEIGSYDTLPRAWRVPAVLQR